MLLYDIFKEYYKFEDKKVKEVVEKYREYFVDKGIFENKIYENMKEILEMFYKNGKILLVVIFKLIVFVEIIFRYFDIDRYFKYIVGSNFDGIRVNKNEVI